MDHSPEKKIQKRKLIDVHPKKNNKKKRLKPNLINIDDYVPPPPPPLALRRIITEGKFLSLKYIDILEKYQLEDEN